MSKVLDRAGHGFDEAAARPCCRRKFKPAETSDGRAVPCSIIWTYRFESDQLRVEPRRAEGRAPDAPACRDAPAVAFVDL